MDLPEQSGEMPEQSGEMPEQPRDHQRPGNQLWPYAFVCEITPTGELLVKDPDLHLASRLGFPKGEPSAGEGWVQAIPAEDFAPSVEALAVLAQGRVWEGRLRMRTVTGEPVILEVRAEPSRLNDGSVSVSAEARDITDVAQLESALAEAEGRLRLLDSVVALGMWTTDRALAREPLMFYPMTTRVSDRERRESA